MLQFLDQSYFFSFSSEQFTLSSDAPNADSIFCFSEGIYGPYGTEMMSASVTWNDECDPHHHIPPSRLQPTEQKKKSIKKKQSTRQIKVWEMGKMYKSTKPILFFFSQKEQTWSEFIPW